jgi:hypothetical protein
MVANPAADAGEGMILLEKLQRLGVFAFVDQGNVALDADMGGTGAFAGGGAPLGDGVAARDCLGIALENGFAPGESFVVLVGNFDGAHLGALAAAGALGKIHIAGRLADFGGKITGFALQFNQLCIGVQIDI